MRCRHIHGRFRQGTEPVAPAPRLRIVCFASVSPASSVFQAASFRTVVGPAIPAGAPVAFGSPVPAAALVRCMAIVFRPPFWNMAVIRKLAPILTGPSFFFIFCSGFIHRASLDFGCSFNTWLTTGAARNRQTGDPGGMGMQYSCNPRPLWIFQRRRPVTGGLPPKPFKHIYNVIK